MEALLVSVLALTVLCSAPFIAHLSGWLTSRYLRVDAGAIREWMPSIPDHIEEDGAAEARWERRRKSVEAKLLRKFSGGVTGAEAHSLAGELGEDPEVVAGALSHMREELPTRLRVTRGGKLLHDFSADAISTLRNKRRMAWPMRLGIFVLGVFANLGAAWPVVMGLLVAAGALGMIAAGASVEVIGGTALVGVAALFVLNFVAGWLTHLVLTPGLGLTGRPSLGPTRQAEESFVQLQDEQTAGWLWFGSGSNHRSSSSSSGCGGDIDGDAGEAIIVILLLAVVAACTFALYVFARGIWRAATGSGMPPLDLSPTQWVRSTQPNDKWERFIPTNDLVLRFTRVMRRLLSHTHPRDSTIVGRVMARARQNGGRISALEIALQEGMDLDTATAAGARLSGRAGGRIDVTDGGEIDFVFPAESLSEAPAQWDDDLHAEYIDYEHDGGTLKRRARQEHDQLPINLPGIAWSHVKSASRLAAGTVLMMLTGMIVVSSVPDIPLFIKIAVDSVLPLMAIGTFALAGALRYATSTLAAHGARRDIRRAAFLHIRRALKRNQANVRFEPLISNLYNSLRPAWSGLDRKLILREIRGVVVDLELEPTGDGETYSVQSLRERRRDIESHRELIAEVEFDFTAEAEGDDEVIFDSHIEHDRVRALG